MTPVIQIPESVHAILSPSKAHLWLACTGGLAAAKGVQGRGASRYAAEGTVYHDVARRALLDDKDCTAYVGDRYEVQGFAFIVDADNAEEAQKYVDAIRLIPGKRMVEVDLEYSALLGVPQWHVLPASVDVSEGASREMAEVRFPVAAGTGDCVIVDYENRIIHSHDLKFGRGDIVYAAIVSSEGGVEVRKPNPQLALYAAAAVERYEILGIDDDWRVSMAIHQPRVNHYDQHVMTVGELRAWVLEQRQNAQAAYAAYAQGPSMAGLEALLVPGEKQCRWCPLSGNCIAQSNRVLGMFPTAAPSKDALVQLSDEALTDALDRCEEIDNFTSAVRAEALARAEQGHVLPNWKLVPGRRGNRALPEDTDAASVTLTPEGAAEIGIQEVEDEYVSLPLKDALHFALGKDAYKPLALKTVAQLEKPLAKKAPLLWAAMQEHITQADGKMSLARIEDPRAPAPIITAEFPVTGQGASLL